MQTVVGPVSLTKAGTVREVQIAAVACTHVSEKLGGGRKENWRGKVGKNARVKGEVANAKVPGDG